jgi:arginyl-tRNA synthetase
MQTSNSVSAQEAMSLLLKALGFDAMAAGVATESDPERLAKYAKVIVKNSKPAMKARALETLKAFGIYPAA